MLSGPCSRMVNPKSYPSQIHPMAHDGKTPSRAKNSPGTESKKARAKPAGRNRKKKALEKEGLSHDFLARLGHELRNPLNGLLGFLRLAEEELDRPEENRGDHLTHARQAGESLLELVENFLDLGRLDTGQLTLENNEFTVENLLAEVARSLAPQAHDKWLNIDYLADPALPARLMGDEGRLRQVLFNLAGNAIKFTRDGMVLLRVKALPAKGENCLLRFSVEDTGAGIAKSLQSSIFDRYVQGGTTGKGNGGGLGLGLTISRQIVERMGGEMGLESKVGEGSAFWFTVTLSPPPSGEELPPAPGPRLGGSKILLLDPQNLTLAVYQEKLSVLGAHIEVAPTRGEALAKLEEGWERSDPFRVVLVSSHLAPEKLREFARSIRSREKVFQPDLALLTKTTEAEEGENLCEYGFTAILTMPVPPEELRNTLGSLIARQTEQGVPAAGTGMVIDSVDPLLPKGAAAPLPGGNVLVVEDNVVNQKLIGALLSKEGYGFTLAANGKVALEIFSESAFDLVLMDIQMPEMDGLTATRRLRETPEGRTVPIIAMTASTLKGDRERCLEAGMNDFIAKPIMPDLLRNKLLQWGALLSTPPLVEPAEPEFEPVLAALDEAHLESVQMYTDVHDPNGFSAWVRAFLADVKREAKELDEARHGEEWERAAGAANRLRLTCGGFGAPRLRELARELRGLSHPDGKTRFDALKPRLERECDSLRGVLERRLEIWDQHPGSPAAG